MKKFTLWLLEDVKFQPDGAGDFINNVALSLSRSLQVQPQKIMTYEKIKNYGSYQAIVKFDKNLLNDQWLSWLMKKLRANNTDVSSIDYNGDIGSFFLLKAKNEQSATGKYGYHVTPEKYAEIIKQQGLRPASNDRISKNALDKFNSFGRIFFCDSLKVAQGWVKALMVTRRFEGDELGNFVIVTFDLDKAGIKKTDIRQDLNAGDMNSFYIQNKVIPPHAIVSIG